MKMLLPPDIIWQQRLKYWAKILAYCIEIIGGFVLIGWELNVSLLKRLLPGLPAMNPMTAVCFVLFATAFLLEVSTSTSKKTRILSKVLILIVLLICGVRIIGILSGIDFHVDNLLFAKSMSQDVIDSVPSRMSPNTAISFVLCGIAMLLFRYETSGGRMPAHYIAILIVLMSLLSLLGYLYQVKNFLGVLTHIQMALPTAICFFFAGFIILFANPEKGLMRELTSQYTGSVAARILIPAAIIIPALLGLLRLWSYWAGVYNVEFGVALYALFTIVIFTAFIWYNTYSLNRRDHLRNETDAALQASEQQNRGIFTNAPDSIVVIDEYGMIVKWNMESERLFGWKADELIGKSLTDVIIPPEFRESHKKGMSRYLSTGNSSIMGTTIDLWALKKNGEQVDVSLRISPLFQNDKRFFIGFIRDITDRKQIEDKLKTFNDELARQVDEKTAELTDIFERVTDGFIALDRDFCYIYLNKKAGELIHREPAELIGKNVWDIFPDAVGSSTYDSFNKAMTEQVYVCSTDYYEPFNLWQENHIYPSPRGLSIFIRDITEKKHAEAQISAVNDLADKLIDSLPGVFYFFDSAGRFIRWNKQFEETTGFSAAEIAEMHPTQFFPDDERNYIASRIAGVFQYGVNDAEANFLTKKGQKIPFYFKAVLINYKGGPCLLGNGIDITERKKAEELLRTSEQKYKLLFESNPLPMWMLGLPEYDVREVNTATLRQYGYSREEFLALDIFKLRPEEDVDKLKAATDRKFRGIHNAGIWRHQKKDGTIIYANVITHDIIYEEKPVRLVLSHEVTEQYLAEEKLKDSYESIRKLTEHLQNIREEERLHIAREIHDELGQLLTVLKMDVSWLNKKVQPASEPVKQKLIELLSLIDTTVRTVRRIASELRPSLLDDLGLLAAMEWHLEEFERRSGISQEANLPAVELKLPDSYKIGLFRIFQESLTNVARHSEAKKVSVSLIQKDKQLILSITDNGKGISDEKGHRKTLGLLGMKERTLVMGGEYSISSKPGEGTTVNVMVPLPDEDTTKNLN